MKYNYYSSRKIEYPLYIYLRHTVFNFISIASALIGEPLMFLTGKIHILQ